MSLPMIAAALVAAAVPAGTPPAPGTITIEQGDDAAVPPGANRAFTDAVQAAILRANFIPLPAPSHSRYIATFSVTRKDRGVVTSSTRGSAPAAGIANWGLGVGVRLPKKDDQLRDLVITQLTVTIVSRADHQPVWSGSALTAQVDGTRAGAPDAVAVKLADAALSQFPQQVDAPVSVP